MKKPILVTGTHRSGSTWVGKIISSSSEVGYIHEPFNKDITRYNHPFDHQFEFVSDYCSESQQNRVRKYMESFVGLPGGTAFKRLFLAKSFKDFLLICRELFNFKRRIGQRTLFKDPLALLSAEWLYANFNCDVVVVIRHPAAFVASLMVKGWEFDFNNLLNQEQLMLKKLESFRDEIEVFACSPKPILEQGILLWRIHSHFIHQYEKEYAGKWNFVKHEDLSIEPLIGFKSLFSNLRLGWTKKVEMELLDSTQSSVQSKLKRNSAENIKSWKKRLTTEQIAQIKEESEDYWKLFYSEKDWE